jgi:hypothetical protein
MIRAFPLENPAIPAGAGNDLLRYHPVAARVAATTRRATTRPA